MTRWIALLATLSACAPRPSSCPLPRTHVVENGHTAAVPVAWIRGAWTSGLNRLQRYPICDAAEGVEVWLRYHRGEPLLCARRPPYYTCTTPGHTPGLYYVEINLEAPGDQTVFDLLAHEFLHVLMYRLGAPRAAHHEAMRTSTWTIRRSALDTTWPAK